MYERDLELGTFIPRPANGPYSSDVAAATQSSTSSETLWANSNGRTDLGRDGLSVIPEKEGGRSLDRSDDQANEEYVKLPRRTVEQLMGMWIDVLQDSLKEEGREQSLPPRSDHSRPQIHRRLPSNPFGQYPPILRSKEEQPWNVVERMSDEEIEAENGYRRLHRTEWRSSGKMTDLEDPWRYLWEPSPGVDKGLFQWPGSQESRIALQLELADALTGNARIVAVNMYMQRDFRALSTWISLIGLRLNEQYRAYRGQPAIGPLIQIKVLIECIWACNAFDPNTNAKRGYREGPRLSNVLTACYRRGVLNRPEEGFDDYVTKTYLQRQCQMVRKALHLVNMLQNHNIVSYMPIMDLKAAQNVWDMPLPDLEAPAAPLINRASDLRDGAEVFLRIDDFNLRDLQILGHLQIQWTSYWDEHLQLETSSTANTLKIFWFQPRLGRYLVENHLTTYIPSSDLNRREDEIYRTWCLIFTSKTSPRTSLIRYRSLLAPRWLSLLAHPRLSSFTAEQATNSSPNNGPLLSAFTRSSSLKEFCFETSDHLLLRWSKDNRLPHERISYSQFPVYADRLRELRTYMDSQQPKGLRALWKDRRNSNTYYTFWFVTIFGTLSVFLATCALAVSIAQTWAAFKQVGL